MITGEEFEALPLPVQMQSLALEGNLELLKSAVRDGALTEDGIQVYLELFGLPTDYFSEPPRS